MEKDLPQMSVFRQESEQWKTDIGFCRDEINVLNRYLQEIRNKNADDTSNQELTDFGIKLSEKIAAVNDLMNEIGRHEEHLAGHFGNESTLGDEHIQLAVKIKMFSKQYAALKSVFVRFLAKADIII